MKRHMRELPFLSALWLAKSCHSPGPMGPLEVGAGKTDPEASKPSALGGELNLEALHNLISPAFILPDTWALLCLPVAPSGPEGS